MSKAYLTIDDSPTAITPALVDYLCSKGIVPMLNFIGAAIDSHFDQALYAIQKGAIIGNHSDSHAHFSTLTLNECRNEIARTEEKINRAYECAGVERKHRVFRFPYGDKGGANAPFIQTMLREEFRFERLDDAQIHFPWWKEHHLDTNVDMHWSFDFVEYQLSWNNGYTWDSIVKRVLDKNPEMGGPLLEEHATNIVLMHDNEETNAFMPEYYQKLIDFVMDLGVEFLRPVFMTCEGEPKE